MTEGIPGRWVSDSGEYAVIVSDSALRDIIVLARRHRPNEVGTSLVGHYSTDGFTAYVDGIAPLAPDSKASRMSFQRGVAGLKEFFQRLLHALGPEQHYVGEWHSHPGAGPSPSRRDDETQAAIAADQKTNCPEVVLLIAGGNLDSDVSLKVFVYSRQRGRIDLLPANKWTCHRSIVSIRP